MENLPAILRVRDLINKDDKIGYLGMCYSTFYTHVVNGDFPPKRLFGGSVKGWLRSDVDKWLESRPTEEEL